MSPSPATFLFLDGITHFTPDPFPRQPPPVIIHKLFYGLEHRVYMDALEFEGKTTPRHTEALQLGCIIFTALGAVRGT